MKEKLRNKLCKLGRDAVIQITFYKIDHTIMEKFFKDDIESDFEDHESNDECFAYDYKVSAKEFIDSLRGECSDAFMHYLAYFALQQIKQSDVNRNSKYLDKIQKHFNEDIFNKKEK